MTSAPVNDEDYELPAPAASAASGAPPVSDEDYELPAPVASVASDAKPAAANHGPVTSFPPPFPVQPGQTWARTLLHATDNIPSAVGRFGENLVNGVGSLPNGVGALAGAASGRPGAIGDFVANNPVARAAIQAREAFANPSAALHAAGDSIKQTGSDLYDKWLTSDGWKKNIGEDLPGTLVGIASVADPALRGARAVDAAGATSLAASPRFGTLLTESGIRLNPADLPPGHLQSIADAINSKGWTPAAVREGFGNAASGVTPSRGATTGYAAGSPAAAGAAADRNALGAAAATDNLRAIAGGPPVTPEELGNAYVGVRDPSKAAADRAYADMRAAPGYLHPAAGPFIAQHVQHALASFNDVFSSPEIARNVATTAPVQRAVDTVANQLATAPPGRLNLNFVDNLRQSLRRAGSITEPADSAQKSAAVAGLDRGLSSAMDTPNAFIGGDAAAAHASLLDARTAASRHFDLFGDSDNPTAIRQANKVVDNADDAHQAGAKLQSALLNPTTGPGLYDHLQRTGIGPTVDRFVRNRLLDGGSDATEAMLSSPLGRRTFSAGEQQQIRLHNEGRRIFEPTSSTPEPMPLGAQVWKGVKSAGAGAAVGLAAHSLGLGPDVASIAGAVSAAGEPLAEHFLSSPVPKELAGAPTTAGRRAGRASQTVLDTALGANALQQAGALPDRQGHAYGGKVGHQHLVDRFMRGIEQAKKAEQARTSVLLKQPDEAVAKALNVAQQAI